MQLTRSFFPIVLSVLLGAGACTNSAAAEGEVSALQVAGAATPVKLPFDVKAAIAAARPAFLELPISAEAATCEPFVQSLAARGIEHGVLAVPIVYGVAGGPTLRVHYYGQWTGRAGTSPVTYFNGGPGSKVWNAAHKIQFLGAHLEELAAAGAPWVVFDQRGNGCSTGFPTLFAANAAEASLMYAYSSQQIVQDAEALRLKLFGSKKWVVTGNSYGSLLVQQYTQLYPDSLKAAHAQGYGVLEDRKRFREAFHRYSIELFENVWKQHPEWASKRAAMFQKYESDVRAKCTSRPNECALGLYPDNLVNAAQLQQSPQLLADFADAVSQNKQPSSRPWETFPDSLRYDINPRTAGVLSVARIDYAPSDADPADIYGCAAGQKAMFAKYTVSQLAGLKVSGGATQCYRIGAQELQTMQWLGTLSTGPSLLTLVASIKAHPKLAFHLYQGLYDNLAPPTYVADMRQRLEGLPNFTFQNLNGNHGAFTLPEFFDAVLASMKN